MRTWYLAPIGAVIAIVVVTTGLNSPMSALLLQEPFVLFALTGYVVLCVLLFWSVWVLNRRAVRKQLDHAARRTRKTAP